MKHHLELTDTEFERGFENCTLNEDLFSHEAHLRLAWIHLNKYGLEKAIDNICNQLTAFVNHLGAQGKYNKTLTVAAVRMVEHFMRNSNAENFIEFVEEFPRLKTDFRSLIAVHYSIDIFNSQEAKTTYLEPDLIAFE